MLLARLAEVSREVAATSARSEKIALMAELFRAAEPEDVAVAIPYLAGRLPQGRPGIGWSVLRDPVEPAREPRLTLLATDAVLTGFAAVSGPGSQTERRRLVRELMSAATAEEQRFLYGLLTGEVRQGALDAVAAEGLARAVGAPAAEVRRAVMLGGSLAAVAQALLARGPDAVAEFRLTVGRPVFPMLAHTAKTVGEAVARLGPCAVEEKLDGIRMQAHRDGDGVRIFTRTLEDITDRLPEVTAAVLALDGDRFVLDGEVIAFDDTGRPRPFQDIAGRVGSRVDVETARAELPVSPVFFDILAAGGRDLLDLPLRQRHAELARLVPGPQRVRRLAVEDPSGDTSQAEAESFLSASLDRGHEGVVVKSLESAYSAGRRGAAWLKVKPVHTLDLVVLAAEWGHGRRTGKLSNLHLGARGPGGTWVMLGKTFKGLTDEMLAWQTERLRELAESDDGWVVRVRPQLVVEIAYDGIQRSTRYPGGIALRFARVLRYRTDKRPEEADTIESVTAAHTRAHLAGPYV
ncbi:ATP-dependent DNA ligase [Streptomyces sp. GC420]|uniref:ATP-dependent DNA ligase n=1 Tax=Streptomyces sp. GC420 TaxID=2697568 RepID=UPI0014152AE1|nr:ATP-dependent DNA ligase [Streptomyces sp. GC420]NBM20562.1 ATP-dependent DNA ligase [Streptomyces sp. GC420]